MTEAIIPLISLIALEVILGIDNIIFISILADKLPEKLPIGVLTADTINTSFMIYNYVRIFFCGKSNT